jgi:chondroitin AC lyase
MGTNHCMNWVVFAILLSPVAGGGANTKDADLQRLGQNVIAQIIDGQANLTASEIEAFATTLNARGSWPDINYHPSPNVDTRTNWPPLIHLQRMLDLAVAYAANRVHRPVVLGACKQALSFWLGANLTNKHNWYSQFITAPLAVGRSCLLLQSMSQLPSAFLPQCTAAIQGADWSRLPLGMSNISAANMVWMATARIYGGLLNSNKTLVSTAVDHIWSELYVTSGSSAGLKADGSFFQHTNPVTIGGVALGTLGQLYSGGYGNAFSSFLLSWVVATQRTMWETPARVGALLGSMVLDGQDWMIVGDCSDAMSDSCCSCHFDASVIGREISR